MFKRIGQRFLVRGVLACVLFLAVQPAFSVPDIDKLHAVGGSCRGDHTNSFDLAMVLQYSGQFGVFQSVKIDCPCCCQQPGIVMSPAPQVGLLAAC